MGVPDTTRLDVRPLYTIGEDNQFRGMALILDSSIPWNERKPGTFYYSSSALYITDVLERASEIREVGCSHRKVIDDFR